MIRITTTIAAIFSYFVLYSPQPLLPFFAEYYHIDITSAGALMTATLIPLAAAPMLYGHLLSHLAPLQLLRYALLTMSISCLLFAYSNSYSFAFFIRFAQGLLLPAVLTAVTTYIATDSRNSRDLQKNMSLFITGTILGGLLGRVISGFFATYFSWQLFYYGLSLALLLTALSIHPQHKKNKTRHNKINFRNLGQVLLTTNVMKIYISIFCLFFCFIAVLNYLPFIIEERLGKTSPIVIGLIYSGFIMGVISSLNAHRLLVLIGRAKSVMMVGFIIFSGAIALLFIPNIVIIFAVLFLFCGSMFLVHSIAVAEVNQLNKKNKNITNALYMTFYYTGGVIGSYFPGLIYQYYGHNALLTLLLGISSIGLLMILSITRMTVPQTGHKH